MERVLWRVAKRLSCVEEPRRLKVKQTRNVSSQQVYFQVPYITFITV